MQSNCNFQFNYKTKQTFLTEFQQMESGQLSFINEKLKEENGRKRDIDFYANSSDDIHLISINHLLWTQ